MAQITKPADLAAHTTYSCGSAIVALSEGDVAAAIDHLTRERDLLAEMQQGQAYIAGIPDDFNPIVFAAEMTYAQGAALVALCKGAVTEALEVLEMASTVGASSKPKTKRTTRKSTTKAASKPDEAEAPKAEPKSKPAPKAEPAPAPTPEPTPAPAPTEGETHVDIDPTDEDPWASADFGASDF